MKSFLKYCSFFMMTALILSSCSEDPAAPAPPEEKDPVEVCGITANPVAEFEDDFSSAVDYEDYEKNGWMNVIVSGERKWQGKDFAGNKYLQASAHKAAEGSHESWLISPPLDIDNATKKVVSFKTAKAYWKSSSMFEVYVLKCENDKTVRYKITPTIAKEGDDDHDWIESGEFDLSSYSGTIHIAFKYLGEGGESNSTTWRIDDFVFGKEPTNGGGNESGTGTKDDPYNPAYVINAADDGSITGWVKGYIIGTIPSTGEATLTGPFDVHTNMLIAESADETDVTKMVSVQLPSGAIRDALNLKDNSGNHKKEVLVYGALEYYYGFKGVKALTGYWIDGDGIEPGPGDMEKPANSFFFENFASVVDYDDIAIQGWNNVAETGTRKWIGKVNSGNHYAQFSAYNSAESNNVSWLVTPAIDLTGKTAPKLSFETTIGYDNGATLQVFISTDYTNDVATATWTELSPTLASKPETGNYSDWVKSGDIDLSSYSGSIYVAFKYVGGDTGTSKTTTWQVDNFNCFE